MGPEAKDALEDLKASLGDKDPSVRLYAAQGVHQVGGLTKQAVPVLAACLEEEEATLRAAAAEALGEIGPPVKDVDRKLPAKLIEMMKDRDDSVKRAAHEALRKIDPRAVPKR
jgi:HEAT repeat protein